MKQQMDNKQHKVVHGQTTQIAHVANMGLTLVLPAPGGPLVGPMNLAIRVQTW